MNMESQTLLCAQYYQSHIHFFLKVCNLKEEVRNYQIHKQSEAQFQAINDMLAEEKASKCDAAEESCQAKCHLEK
jgi:kinesin family member 15